MMGLMPQELTVGFNPMAAAERVAHYNGLVRTRLIWLGVAVVICLAIWLWQRSALSGPATMALWGVGIALSVVWVVLAVVGRAVANRVLARVGQGVAVRIGRAGIAIAGAAVSWPEVAAVTTSRSGVLGTGPALAVQTASGGCHRVPFLYLDAKPGAIDAAVRAYSLGSHNLDTSRLGN
ncbi:MAG: hypothetical protein LBH76_10935 [Propionibacteriaceae bacterium]|jgi:hypothetical protein|nr:hypothetical protein [Propionibacteriaceae bacterium]